MLSYANALDRVEMLLQDSDNEIFGSTELGYWMKDGLKYFSLYKPIFIDVLFQVESRTGKDTAGTASSLTDTTKSQFVATDDDNEKVIHNTHDDTWAVVKTYTSASVLVLTADIMDKDESYEIYNKRCRNKKQIYIGDIAPYLWVESVEYPLGTERNFHVISPDIIEVDVEDSTILDSDSTLTNLNQTDVLVKFAVPQVLCQLTDLAGATHTEGAAKATSLQVKSFTDAEVIEVGEMFNIADHLTTYIVTTELTLANQASTGSTLYFYPSLEATALADGVITFVSSTLHPNHEDLYCRLVAARAAMSKPSIMPLKVLQRAIPLVNDGKFTINESNKGGPGTPTDYLNYANAEMRLADTYKYYRDWGEREMAKVQSELEHLASPKVSKILPKT